MSSKPIYNTAANPTGPTGEAGLQQKMQDLQLGGTASKRDEVFEGRLVEGSLKSGGQTLQATSGSGPNKVVYNYSTDRIVGNGSFGVVFQATCLETGEPVRRRTGHSSFTRSVDAGALHAWAACGACMGACSWLMACAFKRTHTWNCVLESHAHLMPS